MGKYRSITIRRAPEHVRPLMRIVNEMDKQMKRFQKSIAEQIEVADAYRESDTEISSLRFSLELSNRKHSPSEPDPLDIQGDYIDDDVIELEIPDFNSPKAKLNSWNCGCPHFGLDHDSSCEYKETSR